MNVQTKDPDYHKDKMRENREQWKALGVTTFSTLVPVEYREWFSAVSLMAQGKAVMDMVEDSTDHDLLDMFGQRRPRYTVTMDMLDDLRDTTQDESVAAGCDRLEEFLRQSRRDKASALEAGKRGEDSTMLAYFAREYGAVTYVKGAYEMLVYLNRGGTVPSVLDADVPDDDITDAI